MPGPRLSWGSTELRIGGVVSDMAPVLVTGLGVRDFSGSQWPQCLCFRAGDELCSRGITEFREQGDGVGTAFDGTWFATIWTVGHAV